MALTDKNLVVEQPNLDGTQRLYRFADGHGLSLINAPMAHSFRFAWEAAVLGGIKKDGTGGRIQYATPLTNDVEVFQTDAEANAFIAKARAIFDKKRMRRGAAERGLP